VLPHRLRIELRDIPHVTGVHELHVWELVDSVAIGSAHIVCESYSRWLEVSVATRERAFLFALEF